MLSVSCYAGKNAYTAGKTSGVLSGGEEDSMGDKGPMGGSPPILDNSALCHVIHMTLGIYDWDISNLSCQDNLTWCWTGCW